MTTFSRRFRRNAIKKCRACGGKRLVLCMQKVDDDPNNDLFGIRCWDCDPIGAHAYRMDMTEFEARHGAPS